MVIYYVMHLWMLSINHIWYSFWFQSRSSCSRDIRKARCKKKTAWFFFTGKFKVTIFWAVQLQEMSKPNLSLYLIIISAPAGPSWSKWSYFWHRSDNNPKPCWSHFHIFYKSIECNIAYIFLKVIPVWEKGLRTVCCRNWVIFWPEKAQMV